jgi:hypothetical protein
VDQSQVADQTVEAVVGDVADRTFQTCRKLWVMMEIGFTGFDFLVRSFTGFTVLIKVFTGLLSMLVKSYTGMLSVLKSSFTGFDVLKTSSTGLLAIL